MQILTLSGLQKLTNAIGIPALIQALAQSLHQAFCHWHQFEKDARLAYRNADGVFELMPTLGPDYFAYKYVNGHPHNPEQNKPSVMGLGMLCDINNGEPLFLSEMTVLTAWRTAIVTAIASKAMARTDSTTMALIGCGAQSEFLALAHLHLMDIHQIHYYDLDANAMAKFAANLADTPLQLVACDNSQQACKQADIIITATTAHTDSPVFNTDALQAGVHIGAIGGDGPGKTELDPKVLDQAHIVVEFTPQTEVEGEIQHGVSPQAELWQVLTGEKPGRPDDQAITLFDSVGFAVEDYASLSCIYDLAKQHQCLDAISIVPQLSDQKNLFGEWVASST
jgi:ornithine cyclodeaminase